MPSEAFLTGLTASKVNAPRVATKRGRPVRPVSLTTPDGSAVLIAHARTRTERKAADPSDPSGAGTTATVVREATGDACHLAATQRIRICYVICAPGEPLCGFSGALQPCLDTLFPPEPTCWMCILLANRDGIRIAGSDAA